MEDKELLADEEGGKDVRRPFSPISHSARQS
jgi:hypothetical protein